MTSPVGSRFAPHLGRDVKLGRRRPTVRGPRLSLKDYLPTPHQLPPPPPSIDYSPKALAALRNLYLNDQYGDCMIATGYHIEGVATGNAGSLFVASDDQILEDYKVIGGFDPTDPSTDQGCDERTAIEHWTHKGFANGTKLLGSVAVDGRNTVEVQQALYLFENLMFCVELPDSWVDPVPSADGFVWDLDVPNPDNGHAFAGVGHNAQGVLIATWQLLGLLTWKAIARLATPLHGGDLLVLFTPDQFARGQKKAPNDVAWDDLLADFRLFGGVPSTLPPPSTDPSPSP